MACAAAAIITPTVAMAEIHDYMILRLLYLKTSCGVDKLQRLTPDGDPHPRFHAHCRDVASYPEGIDIACTDSADDRSCKILSPPQNFHSLELLRPKDN